MQLLSAEKETWLAGDVRRLTLKIAAPSVAAMVASAFCSLLETLILGRSDAQLSAAIGACFALTALEQTVGFTLGMGAGSSVSRCLLRFDMSIFCATACMNSSDSCSFGRQRPLR